MQRWQQKSQRRSEDGNAAQCYSSSHRHIVVSVRLTKTRLEIYARPVHTRKISQLLLLASIRSVYRKKMKKIAVTRMREKACVRMSLIGSSRTNQKPLGVSMYPPRYDHINFLSLVELIRKRSEYQCTPKGMIIPTF